MAASKKTRAALLEENERLRGQLAAAQQPDEAFAEGGEGLWKSRASAKAIVEALPDMMFRLSGDGTYLDYHAPSVDLFYASHTVLIGNNIHDVLPTNIADLIQSHIRKTLDTGEMQVFTYTFPYREGWEHFENRMVVSGENEVLSVIRNITEQVNARNALRESEERYRELIETMPDGIGIRDQNDEITFVNDRLCEMLGYERDELVGRTVASLVGEGRQAAFAEFQDSWTGHEVDPFELDLERKDGETLCVLVSPRVRRDENGNYLGGFAVMTDITLRKRIEEAEREQRMWAEALRDTAAALTRNLDMDSVLDAILENVERVVPDVAADVMLVEGGVARVVRSRGYAEVDTKGDAPGIQLPVAEAANLRQMADTGKPLAIPDTRDYPWVTVLNESPTRSCAGAPIALDGKTLGFLSLNSPTPGALTDDHAGRLQAFADQAAIAIKNARLYEQVQQNVAQLEALRRVSLDITTRLDLDVLLKEIVRQANELLDVKAGGIYFYRPERDVLEWTVYDGEWDAADLGSELKRDEGLSGKVWESGQPIWVDDYVTWEGRAPLYKDFKWTAVLGVPIQWGDEFLGVINALTDAPKHTFSQDDADLLSLFAAQAAIAIKNARLFDEIQQYAAQLEVRVDERTRELKEARDHVEAILNSVGEGVAVFDVEGHIEQVNPAFRKQVGLAEDDKVPADASTFVPGGVIPDDVLQEAKKALDTSRIWHTESQVARLDGEIYDAAVTVTPLHDAGGDAVRFVGSVRDIGYLKEVDNLKQEFMRLVSHEMRTPLTSIKGFSSMLMKDSDPRLPDQTAREYAEIISHASDRLTSIIDMIVNATRIYAGEVKPERQPIALSGVVEAVVSELESRADENDQQITISLPDDLPPLSADKDRLREVLHNLVENAVVYAGQGTHIHIEARELDAAHANGGVAPGPCVEICVRDDGCGIDPAEQEHVFEPFHRAGDPAQQDKTKAGLGLYFVRELVNLHGGATRLESAPGEGSAFYVIWPIHR